ncbi:hypothetical protein GWQ44_04760 [Pseudomonas sp. 3MA1]|uniref:hypothetical protein n=1 Tax=Pseudomonas sp. 3MA1 TaxID=2699196 RepID=UPI0023DE01E4|nr:hypothetical protein [Pseudomonas sp. 3MA1]MDF2394836.1 hypothetical protein [Pseudomonas sp. 3MA1]
MIEIVGLLAFVKKLRAESDLVKNPILNPEFRGLHYFYAAMQMLYKQRDLVGVTLHFSFIEDAVRGKTLRTDDGFVCWLMDELIDNNHEPSVQALLSKLYWLCQHAESNALYEELLRFYVHLGAKT